MKKNNLTPQPPLLDRKNHADPGEGEQSPSVSAPPLLNVARSLCDFRRGGRGVRLLWSHSRLFRFLLIAASVYFVLRFAVDIGYLVINIQQYGGRTDLTDYLAGALNFHNRLPLYAPGPVKVWEFYRYSPFFALAFTPFLWVSPVTAMAIHTLLHLPIYALLYLRWARLFDRLELQGPLEALAWSLPLWLVFDGFWSDLALLNIYILTALVATLLLEAVLFERSGWALVWLSILLQVKPQWAFPLVIPLLFGRWKFFFRLVGLAAAIYLAVGGVVMFSAGVGYTLQQYRDYVHLLFNMPAYLPWRTQAQGFLGYNHSLKAIAYFWLGQSPAVDQLVMAVKVLLLAPLALVALGCWRAPLRQPGRAVPQRALELAFLFYLGAFLWLDEVWELSLGIVLLVYWLGVMPSRGLRAAAWVFFLPYALLDLWRILSVIIFGTSVILPDAYVTTDPATYFPVILITIVGLYGLFLYRWWEEGAKVRNGVQSL
jgi:hypothetical protein